MSDYAKDLVFVVSGGRTGTQFLGDRLSSAIEGSFSVHDPDILSVYMKRVPGRIRRFGLYNMTLGKLLGHTGLRSIGHRLITGRIDQATALRQLSAMRMRFHQSIKEDLVIESNSQWLYVCDELACLWPNARVIIVIRDPRTWVRSWLNKGIRWRTYDPVRLLPPGRLTPELVGDQEWVEPWRSFDTMGCLAWEWRFVYGRLLDHASRNPNARIYRFEDIFRAQDDSGMAELVKFAASHEGRLYPHTLPEDFTATVQNASTGPARDWQEWTHDQAKLLDSLCGSLMREFGYGNEPEWKQKLGAEKQQRK